MEKLELRPKTFIDYIGQENTITNLSVYVSAAKKRGDILDHIIIHGQSGCGKTTLATVIANELEQKIIYTNGVNFQKISDVISVMTNVKEGNILFIDEIHRIPKNIEEIIYSVLEDSRLDLVYGEGIDKQTINIEVNKFTLIGATTLYGNLSEPFRNRFPINITIEDYTYEEMLKIVKRSSKLLNINMPLKVQKEFVNVTRGIPRIANNLLKRIHDYEIEFEIKEIDLKTYNSIIKKLGINNNGLDNRELKALKIISEFQPIGSDNISKSLGCDRLTYELTIEPYLIKTGFISISKSGRIISEKAKEILKE